MPQPIIRPAPCPPPAARAFPRARRSAGSSAAWGSRGGRGTADRKSTRLNSSHLGISYAVFCLKKKNKNADRTDRKDVREEHNKADPDLAPQQHIEAESLDSRGENSAKRRAGDTRR